MTNIYYSLDLRNNGCSHSAKVGAFSFWEIIWTNRCSSNHTRAFEWHNKDWIFEWEVIYPMEEQTSNSHFWLLFHYMFLPLKSFLFKRFGVSCFSFSGSHLSMFFLPIFGLIWVHNVLVIGLTCSITPQIGVVVVIHIYFQAKGVTQWLIWYHMNINKARIWKGDYF